MQILKYLQISIDSYVHHLQPGNVHVLGGDVHTQDSVLWGAAETER